MRHDCETRQCRRVKFLIQHPVADDVLDIVGHHGEHKSDELGAKTWVAHRRIGPLGRWRRADHIPDHALKNLEIVQMPKKGITGHDEWVVTEALATALVALEQLPSKHQPRAHMDDIKKLLAAGCQPGTLTLHIAQAKCRLFPDVDPLTIYQEYGLEDGQG
jgi:hypothetical protein